MHTSGGQAKSSAAATCKLAQKPPVAWRHSRSCCSGPGLKLVRARQHTKTCAALLSWRSPCCCCCVVFWPSTSSSHMSSSSNCSRRLLVGPVTPAMLSPPPSAPPAQHRLSRPHMHMHERGLHRGIRVSRCQPCGKQHAAGGKLSGWVAGLGDLGVETHTHTHQVTAVRACNTACRGRPHLMLTGQQQPHPLPCLLAAAGVQAGPPSHHRRHHHLPIALELLLQDGLLLQLLLGPLQSLPASLLLMLLPGPQRRLLARTLLLLLLQLLLLLLDLVVALLTQRLQACRLCCALVRESPGHLAGAAARPAVLRLLLLRCWLGPSSARGR